MISVIIPCYNAENSIVQAVQSVLEQDFPDLEVLVVDDGSTDRSAAVLRAAFTVQHAQGRLTVLKQDRKGPAAARNTGIRNARGGFIAFLDADDHLMAGSLARRAALFLKHPEVDLVFSDYLQKDNLRSPGTVMLRSERFIDFCRTAVRQAAPPEYLFSGKLYEYCLKFSRFPLWTGGVMLRKSVFEKTGFFREDLSIAEDHDLWIRLLRLSEAVGFVDAPLAAYLRHQSTLTKTVSIKYYTHSLRCYRDLLPSEVNASARRTLRTHIAAMYYELGYHYWSKSLIRQARARLRLSLRFNPFSFATLRLLILTFTPRAAVSLTRTILRKRTTL